MSVGSDFDMLAEADGLAVYLRRVAALADVPVIVARQRDLVADIDEAVAKAAGAAILIALDGWRNVNASSNRTRLELTHSVSVWTAPILWEGAMEESEVLGVLVSAVGMATSVTGDGCERWVTAGGRYIEHPRHRVYEFPAAVMVDLPWPEMVVEDGEE